MMAKKFQFFFLPTSLAILLLLWELGVDISRIPSGFLPSPSRIFSRLIQSLADGSLFVHTAYTLVEVLAGLILGSLLAILAGYLIAKSPLAEKLLSPYLVASQAVPIVAIAPILVIWFGPGINSKIFICTLIVFFPVLINTIVGIRSVSKDLYDLMRSLRSNRLQILRYLEIPNALPILLGGFRIGATLSVIGAVVGEFIGSNHGLGFLVNLGKGQYDTALVFVAIIILIAMALGLYGIVVYLEKKLLKWKK
jgi:NitT/TauT family transport system permease protein